MSTRRPGPLERAVTAELRRAAEIGWRAALARALARAVDAGEDTLAGRVSAGKLLTATMDSFGHAKVTAAAKPERDALDQLAARRSQRRSS